jgi:hypothetical protein
MSEQPIDTVKSRAAVIDEVTTVLVGSVKEKYLCIFK